MSDEFVELGTLAGEGVRIVSPQEFIEMRRREAASHVHAHAEGTGQTHRFDGRPKVFFLAFCVTCWPDRWAPMPFGAEAERDQWAHDHLSGPLSKDHEVRFFVEVRG